MAHLDDFVHRPIDTLSGAERQGAWMALALAQRTEILLLDEPTPCWTSGTNWICCSWCQA